MSLTASHYRGGGYVEHRHSVEHRHGDSSLADVVDLILDKGLVIDVFVRVSLLGLEILTIDIRIVVTSVDTFLSSRRRPAVWISAVGRSAVERFRKTAQMISGESAEGQE